MTKLVERWNLRDDGDGGSVQENLKDLGARIGNRIIINRLTIVSSGLNLSPCSALFGTCSGRR